MPTRLEKLDNLIKKLQIEKHKELVKAGEIPIWLYDKKITFQKMWDEQMEFIKLYRTTYVRFSLAILEKLRRDQDMVKMYHDLLVIPQDSNRILSLDEVEKILKVRGFYINEPLEAPYHFAISSPFYKLNPTNIVLK